MSEEQEKFPKVTAGVMVLNQEGKLLLVRSLKWKNQLSIPGGHIEWGEKMADAAKREIKEEIGIDICDVEFLTLYEFIFSDEYIKDRHIVGLSFVAHTKAKEKDVKIDGREITEYVWLTMEEALQQKDLNETIRKNIELIKEKQNGGVKNEDYRASYQRALADYQNLQKETAARRSELVAMSELMILEEFIPVYDNFRKAFNNEQKANSKEQENWAMGIRYIMKQFGDVLKAHGVEEIKTVGEKFDPKFHEAVGESYSSDGTSVTPTEAGVIVKEVDGGYVMRGKVVKVAKVVIAK